MKQITLSLLALFSIATAVEAQVVFSDTFNFATNGTGFALGEGVNAGINPPTTRLTGTDVADLRYINVGGKPATSFLLQANRMRVTAGSQSGRATISADGTTAFDFGGPLGIGAASLSSPVIYDIRVSMDNNASGTTRMSLGLATVETDAANWDFGLQLHKAVAADDFYTVSKRMNTNSIGIANLNQPMTTLGVASAGTEVSFLIRVTDAGAETDAFNSRIQVSGDNGDSWFYDSDEDAALVNGFRFDGAGRFLSLDIAGGNSSFVTYENLSVTPVPEPSTLALAGLGGAALLFLGRRARSSRK